jgi:adenine C2-methylase RlmN of 23S rRNA A2503 and tRNA A37
MLPTNKIPPQEVRVTSSHNIRRFTNTKLIQTTEHPIAVRHPHHGMTSHQCGTYVRREHEEHT